MQFHHSETIAGKQTQILMNSPQKIASHLAKQSEVSTGIVTGDMWHVCLEGLKDVGSLCYGWRAEADVAWEGRSRFHPGTMLYCPVLQDIRSLPKLSWMECQTNVS